uniref:Uncharacterized protein n=1 Tax=viral metagenome TaxID=1070528 RepID=A0A6C0K4N5_9ZZZZ
MATRGSKMTQYLPGDFSFLRDESSRRYANDTYQAVTKAEAWDLMKEDPGDGGFMFSADKRYKVIQDTMELGGEHSGSSYGWSMRQVQYIAQHGWNAYVALFEH